MPDSRDRQTFMERLFGDDSLEKLLADMDMLQHAEALVDSYGDSVTELAHATVPELTASGVTEASAKHLLSAARERRIEHKEIGFAFATMVFADMEVGACSHVMCAQLVPG